MLTPNNRTRLSFKDPSTVAGAWIQNDSYPNLSDLVDEYSQEFVDKLILQACSRINRLANRYFNSQTADEIVIDDYRFYDGYVTYVLKNAPVASITDIYLQIANTFQLVDADYNQLFSDERTIKILPNVFESVGSTTILNLQRQDYKPLNLWIRYVSGYTITDPDSNSVPEDVRFATALMVSHLASNFKNLEGVSEFRTQTYSEKRARPVDNPLLLDIKEIIQPYRLFTVT